MHARPEESELVEGASLQGASGKPSTWFPLGGHVQKDLLSSTLLLLRNLFCRSLFFLSILLGGLRAINSLKYICQTKSEILILDPSNVQF
jgi:hypothetical protein